MTGSPRILDDLRTELVRAAREAEREEAASGRLATVARVHRPVVIAAGIALLLAAVAAAATLIIGRGAPIPPPNPSDVPLELAPVPGTARLNGLDVPDPDGGPAWDVRTSRSATGAICATVGQVLDGDLGLVGLDRRFRALPAGAADACSTPQRSGATLAGARAFRGGAGMSDVTVVNGVAAPSVRRALAVADGRAVAMRIGPAGAFLAVFRGLPEQVRPHVVLTDAAGHRTTLRFADEGEFIAADPSGGTPWALEPSRGANGLRCIAARRERGPDSPAPLPNGALNAIQPSVPARCGRARAPFVDIRRFVPGEQRIGRPSGWGLNPARTVVWGAAGDPRATVILTGAGAARRIPVDPRTGGFLAVLDGRVDPRALRVRLGRRTLASTAGAVGTRGQPLAPERVPEWHSVQAAARHAGLPSREPIPDPRTIAIVRRADDVAGGPPWALRSWSARVDPRLRVAGSDRDLRCFAIGIESGARLLEPATAGGQRVARGSYCNSPRFLARRAAAPVVRTYVDDPTSPSPRVLRVVVAGLLGPGARSAQLIGAGAARPLALGRGGTYLVVLGPDAAGAPLRVRQVRSDGTTVTSPVGVPGPPCAPLPGRSVRIADPDGGPSWTAGTGRTGRGLCQYVARLVDDRPAVVVDGESWVAFGAVESTGDSSQLVSPRRPVVVMVEGRGSALAPRPPAAPATPAQLARRTLPGRTVITGVALPTVTSVTLQTPRDVRTLRPAGGVFLAVYDGAFYGGQIRVAAHLRDGRTVTERFGLALY